MRNMHDQAEAKPRRNKRTRPSVPKGKGECGSLNVVVFFVVSNLLPSGLQLVTGAEVGK